MSSITSTSSLDNLMEATFPENISLDKQSTIRSQLIKGRVFANQLLSLLRNPIDGSTVYVEELAANVLTSFTDTISMLNEATGSTGHVGSGDGMSRQPPVASRKRPATNDKRGSYKRKTAGARNKVSSTMEDEYSWRKYGQKDILNCKQPRCYFRCTHKYDQGCEARKQVQKLEDDSGLYQITYHGDHTCKNSPSKPIDMFRDIKSPGASILSFESNSPDKKKDEKQSPWSNYPTIAASASVSVPEEEQAESKAQSETSENVFSAQSSLLNEMTPFGLLDHEIESTIGFEQVDLFSYDPYEGLMDFPMMRHTDFGADLQFDDIDFQ